MAVISVWGDGELEFGLLDGSGGCVYEMEGVAVWEAIICGAEGVPGH